MGLGSRAEGVKPVHTACHRSGLGVYSPGRVSIQILSNSELKNRWSESLEINQEEAMTAFED